MVVLFAISLARALEPDLDGDGWTEDVDCDDLDASVNPDAVETCDEVDDDCDTLIDDDDDTLRGGHWFFEDLDGDGIGGGGKRYCVRPSGFVRVNGDCDDTDPTIGSFYTSHPDADGDGYGSTRSTTYSCLIPAGNILVGGDCEDDDAAINPGVVETCNHIDDNCDGLVDEDDPALVGPVYYDDSDRDGYGDDAITVDTQCTAPDGYVEVGGDCNVADASTHPNAPELCDRIDNDCDGSVDDAVVAVPWFGDADGDGYGVLSDVERACARPRGYTSLPGDCDDTSAAVFPGAEEVCGNGVDDNCNSAKDDCVVPADDVADFVVSSSASGSLFGAALAIGDVDADGTADLLAGAPAWPDTLGAVFVELGPKTGSVDAATADGMLTSSYASEGVFGPLSFGDANGDGVGDLLVGTPAWWDSDAELFLGPTATGTDPTDPDAVLFPGTLGYTWPGTSVQVIGDHDGDGVGELAVGAPGRILRSGTVFVVPGDVTGTQAIEDAASYRYRLPGTGKFGQALTALDENGDGLSDLLVGAPHAASAYLIDGGALPGSYAAAGVADAGFVGDRAIDGFGSALASGDLDGDGYADALVTAPSAQTETGRSSGGIAYAFFGPLAGTASASEAPTRWVGDGTGAFGTSVATGDDVDGDGQVDTLFGDPQNGWGRGTVYLQLGTVEGVVETDLLSSFASSNGAALGASVAFVPDWSGDGLPEIAIGAPYAPDASGVAGGAVSVIFSDSLFE